MWMCHTRKYLTYLHSRLIRDNKFQSLQYIKICGNRLFHKLCDKGQPTNCMMSPIYISSNFICRDIMHFTSKSLCDTYNWLFNILSTQYGWVLYVSKSVWHFHIDITTTSRTGPLYNFSRESTKIPSEVSLMTHWQVTSSKDTPCPVSNIHNNYC